MAEGNQFNSVQATRTFLQQALSSLEQCTVSGKYPSGSNIVDIVELYKGGHYYTLYGFTRDRGQDAVKRSRPILGKSMIKMHKCKLASRPCLSRPA